MAFPPQTVYLFFESKTVSTNQGDIGAARSTDGGLSFKSLGTVLDEPWHLSYPYVFLGGDRVGVRGQPMIYMIPEGSKSGTLRMYRAESFPEKCELMGSGHDYYVSWSRWVIHNNDLLEPLGLANCSPNKSIDPHQVGIRLSLDRPALDRRLSREARGYLVDVCIQQEPEELQELQGA